MTAAHESVEVAQGREMLAALPELYFAIAKSAQLEATSDGRFGCSINFPMVGRRSCVAPSAREAIHDIFVVVVDECTRNWVHEWPQDYLLYASKHGCFEPSAVVESKAPSTERFQAKGRQVTVGVTMPTTLKEALSAAAEESGESFAELTRQLARAGFEEFEARSFSEDSAELLSELLSTVRSWLPSTSEQVMVRLENNESVRLRTAAKEFRRSASELGAICLATGFAKRTAFVSIAQRVEAVQGPPTRALAKQIGLGKHSSLLASILAGSIRAPKRVLASLATTFETSETMLSDFFQRSFATSEVPAFKADGKPQVSSRAIPWMDAVRSMNLPTNEADELLALDH